MDDADTTRKIDATDPDDEAHARALAERHAEACARGDAAAGGALVGLILDRVPSDHDAATTARARAHLRAWLTAPDAAGTRATLVAAGRELLEWVADRAMDLPVVGSPWASVRAAAGDPARAEALTALAATAPRIADRRAWSAWMREARAATAPEGSIAEAFDAFVGAIEDGGAEDDITAVGRQFGAVMLPHLLARAVPAVASFATSAGPVTVAVRRGTDAAAPVVPAPAVAAVPAAESYEAYVARTRADPAWREALNEAIVAGDLELTLEHVGALDVVGQRELCLACVRAACDEDEEHRAARAEALREQVEAACCEPAPGGAS